MDRMTQGMVIPGEGGVVETIDGRNLTDGQIRKIAELRKEVFDLGFGDELIEVDGKLVENRRLEALVKQVDAQLRACDGNASIAHNDTEFLGILYGYRASLSEIVSLEWANDPSQKKSLSVSALTDRIRRIYPHIGDDEEMYCCNCYAVKPKARGIGRQLSKQFADRLHELHGDSGMLLISDTPKGGGVGHKMMVKSGATEIDDYLNVERDGKKEVVMITTLKEFIGAVGQGEVSRNSDCDRIAS